MRSKGRGKVSHVAMRSRGHGLHDVEGVIDAMQRVGDVEGTVGLGKENIVLEATSACRTQAWCCLGGGMHRQVACTSCIGS